MQDKSSDYSNLVQHVHRMHPDWKNEVKTAMTAKNLASTSNVPGRPFSVSRYILNDYRKTLNPMHFERTVSNDERQSLKRTFGFQTSTLSRNLNFIA